MSQAKLSPAELQAQLSQFSGTESYTRHLGILLTDGARFLAEQADAFWLLDLIFSHQLSPKVRAEEFQVWTLRRNAEGSGAVAFVTDGNSDEPIVSQVIEFTDFPLQEIKLYLIDKVLLLPGEY